MSKFKYIFFLACVSFMAQAQILDEKAGFGEEARGEAIFELNKGEHIYTYEPNDGWYKARKMVYLKPADISDNRLSAGAVFYNKEEQVIGRAIQVLKLYDIDTIEAFRGEDRIKAVVQGYVFETKIEDGTVPEEQISKILAIKNRTEQQKLFKTLFEANEGLSEEFDELEARVIFENNKVSSEEKDFRVIAVFRGSTPYAIITNDHTVEIEKIKDYWEDREFRIYYFYKASASQKQKVEDLIFTYLAL